MPRTALTAVSRFTIAIIVLSAVAACGSSGEKVYMRQNQAATALATMVMEAEARSPANVDRLYAAESQLQEACAPLREMASRRMAGETVGLYAELIAFVSLDRCETETRRVEELVRGDNPGVAHTFLSPTVAAGVRK